MLLLRLGFKFHATMGVGDRLILSLWLRDGLTKNNLPSGPSHFLGVAGLVVRGDGRILVVKEKNGPAARSGIWKLPGGQADSCESIQKAVLREVFEETGVECHFEALTSILHLRPRNGGNIVRAGASDLFCTCVLRTKSLEPKLTLQKNEIASAKWVTAEELLASGFYKFKGTAFRRSIEAAIAARNRVSQCQRGLYSEVLPLGFAKGKISILRSSL
mmetsp:Transcript_29922/g.47973  ORF Transcript_29922/g.47973 Transcript_29922/m.47973 type:complete len:217 (+) Transcript_29922:458-1108(+)